MTSKEHRVAVVGTVGVPANYGGFESLVENLTAFNNSNIKYTIFCSAKNYEHKKSEYNGAQLIYLPIKANGISSIFYDILSMLLCIRYRYDTILILGVSGCIFLPIFRLLNRAKVVTNIDGLEWKRDKWGKLTRWFLKLSEKFAIKYSDEIITDNQAISNYVNDEYEIESHTIAYGGDHSKVIDLDYDKDNYFLSICRIEPENNVAMILEAFSLSKSKIKFIGNWHNSSYGLSLKSKYSTFSNIELIDPIYDLEILQQIRHSSIGYIHGHSAGGTNPSLVEMMHFPVNIFAFDCNFNRFTTHNKAIYFDSSEMLKELISTEIKLDNFPAMNEIAHNEYVWSHIVTRYESLY